MPGRIVRFEVFASRTHLHTEPKQASDEVASGAKRMGSSTEMERVIVNGVELEYEIPGSGEPVLLIHGSHICGSFVPLMDQHILTDDYALIGYHRRGFAGEPPAVRSLGVAKRGSRRPGAARTSRSRVGARGRPLLRRRHRAPAGRNPVRVCARYPWGCPMMVVWNRTPAVTAGGHGKDMSVYPRKHGPNAS